MVHPHTHPWGDLGGHHVEARRPGLGRLIDAVPAVAQRCFVDGLSKAGHGAGRLSLGEGGERCWDGEGHGGVRGGLRGGPYGTHTGTGMAGGLGDNGTVLGGWVEKEHTWAFESGPREAASHVPLFL